MLDVIEVTFLPEDCLFLFFPYTTPPPPHTHHSLTFKKDEGVYKSYAIFLSHFGKSRQGSSITGSIQEGSAV